MNKLLCVALCGLLGSGAYAQQQLPIPQDIQKAYARGTRDLSGKPGPKYWQNTAEYNLKVDFNPSSRLLKGTVAVLYKNSSPDTLREMWFKLYPNLYKKGVPRDSRIAESDQHDGVQLSEVVWNGKAVPLSSLKIEGTNMHMLVPEILPGAEVNVEMNYAYTLNKGSHTRTGQVDDGSHFVAYFFPRIAVYDDIAGWNKYPYTGDAEFYNDFCSFNAEITVPKNFVVWATGDLTNATNVLHKDIARRIATAEVADTVIQVIGSEDLQKGMVTADKPFNTWKFSAQEVTDFVFATSDHYVWKSSSVLVDSLTKRRTRVDAAFNPVHKDYEEVVDFARETVRLMSHDFPKWPFPYAHETVFDGLDQMEYPMMVNDNPVAKREDAITLTVHEIFHTLFPFYMGTNETKYGWMDEGWATMGEWLIGPKIDTTMVDVYGIAPAASSSGSKNDTPIMTLTPDLKGAGAFTNSYPKPALGYLYVKDYLGDTLFTKALHHYIRSWNGKHPMPFDFFYSMNEGAGKNMNWFWKRWFFEDGVTDMGITAVEKTASGYLIKVENKSNKPMAVYLRLSYAEGAEENIHETIGVWEHGGKVIAIPVKTSRTLKQVLLGNAHVPDKDNTNNRFSVK